VIGPEIREVVRDGREGDFGEKEIERGDVSVSGTITVDKLGSLGASDFVADSLSFSSPNYPSATPATPR
jgi:hypothetical protein